MTAPNIELAYTNTDDGQDMSGLLSFLQEEERRSIDDELNAERAVALDFYNGEPFGDEEDGRSQVVTRDVAEVIDPAVASIMNVMLSGDSAVEFDCRDKQLAKVITASVGQEFYQGQDGYRVLHDWIKAGLLEKSSIVKVCVEEQEPIRHEAVVGEEDLAAMVMQGVQPVQSADMGDGTIAIAWLEPRPAIFRDYVVPNEEASIAADARDLDDDCAYLQFRMPRTLSQIAEMGYDVSGLDSNDSYLSEGDLASARDGRDRSVWPTADYRTGPNRRVWLLEEYARYDLDGDGITELLKVHRVASSILHVETIDEQPGVAWCPFPMPSRITGQSLADKVMDIQRTRSVLFRQGLDNIYQSNAPRFTLNEASIGDSTIDDLLTVRPGGIIRHTGMAPEPIALPFVAQSAFDVMQVLSGEKESRTGITRLNQGLDPDALNKTATGTAMMMASGQQMEDYMARNLAEAFSRLMMKKYRLMKKYGQPMTVYVDGEEIDTDPKTWPDDLKVRVRVGLGTGRKDQRLAYRMNLLQVAQQAMQGGLRIFTEENIFNQIAGVIEDSSLGNVSDLMTDPAKLPPAEEKPDPDMLKAQSDAMLQAHKQQMDEQKIQSDAILRNRQMEMDAAMKQQALDYDLTAKREKAALEEQLARDKATFEAELAQQQADREWQLSVMQLAQQRELAEKKADADAEMRKLRPGGELDK